MKGTLVNGFGTAVAAVQHPLRFEPLGHELFNKVKFLG
jgi:hypothetical protein